MFLVRRIDYPLNIRNKNWDSPAGCIFLWFTRIEYSWCTNLAISVMMRSYQCISHRYSHDALQLVTLSRNISTTYHLEIVSNLSRYRLFFPPSKKRSSYYLYISHIIVYSLARESSREIVVIGKSQRFFLWHDRRYKSTDKCWQEQIAKCVLDTRHTHREQPENILHENILARAFRPTFWSSFDFLLADGGIRLYIR